MPIQPTPDEFPDNPGLDELLQELDAGAVQPTDKTSEHTSLSDVGSDPGAMASDAAGAPERALNGGSARLPAVTEPISPRRLRRQVGEYHGQLEQAQNDLVAIKLQKSSKVTRDVAHALACAYLDIDFPASQRTPNLIAAVGLAQKGQLLAYVGVALESVEEEMVVATCALRSIQLLNVLGETAPATWRDMRTPDLARRLNAMGLAIKRSVPGWKD